MRKFFCIFALSAASIFSSSDAVETISTDSLTLKAHSHSHSHSHSSSSSSSEHEITLNEYNLLLTVGMDENLPQSAVNLGIAGFQEFLNWD